MNRLSLALAAFSLVSLVAGCSSTTDGAGRDAGPRPDTGVAPSDSGAPGDDAGVAAPDTGTGGADSGAPDAAAVVCTGVHPIIGPPRTCEAGSCLCVATDACFTADVVDACCEGAFECAPPVVDCMATHPIIGPPRTCESGRCYCANPDACFPADRATGCCSVPVVCVP